MHKARLFFIAFVSAVSAAGQTLPDEPLVLQAPSPMAFDPVNITAGGQGRYTFPSAFSSDYRVNRVVPVHWFMPKSNEPVPVVILLHYWGAVDIKSEADLARRLNDRGIAAVVMELPYHLSRAPEGTRSGQLAIQSEPAEMKATMVQALWDVRRTIDWIQSRAEFDGTRVGLNGTSLGGIVGGLAFAVDPRISAYSSVLGGGEIAETIWSSSRLVREREALRKRGWTKETLMAALLPIEPIEYLKSVETRPAYIVAARYDTIVPTKSYRSLISAIPSAEVLWLETGHYGGFVVQSSVYGSVVNFFQKIFNGEKFTAPKRLYAPTLRLGTPASLESGLQVGLGLDVWKSDENGTAFGTVFFTPKGPQGFLGVNVGNGLGVGISIQPRKTSLGALWSFVL